MAKIKGPLHSDFASGTFKNQMVFRQLKSGCVLSKYYKPGSVNPFILSDSQIALHIRYGQAVGAWKSLDIVEKAVYNDRAKFVGDKFSGWNLFMKEFMLAPPPPIYDLVLTGNANLHFGGSPNGNYNIVGSILGHPTYMRDDGAFYIFWIGSFVTDYYLDQHIITEENNNCFSSFYTADSTGFGNYLPLGAGAGSAIASKP